MTEALPTVPAPTTMPQFATGWQRLAAMIIDGSLVGLASAASGAMIHDYLLHYILWIGLNLAYFVLCERFADGATLGKKIVGIYVVDRNGHKLTLKKCLSRYALWLLPALPITIYGFSPESIQQMQLIQDHMFDPEFMTNAEHAEETQKMTDTSMILWGVSAFLSLILIGIPVLKTKEHTGLHDHFSGTRVYQTAAPKPRSELKVKLASGWQRGGAIGMDIIIAVIAVKLCHILIPYKFPQAVTVIGFLFVFCAGLEASPYQATPGKRLVGIFVASQSQRRQSLLQCLSRTLLFLLPIIPLLIATSLIDFKHIILTLHAQGSDAKQIQAAFLKPDILYPLGIYMATCFFAVLGIILFHLVPIFATRERTGLHDWLSGTRVYQGKPQPAPSAPSAPDAAA